MTSGIDRRTGRGNRHRHGAIAWIDGRRVATPEYNSWQLMRNRCLNKKSTDWRYYGGRGIMVDPRWNKFENFLADMGYKPSPELTLDRKDGNKPYCKKNCRWATRKQQSRNRACVKLSMELAAQIRAATGRQVDIAKQFGISQGRVSQIKRGIGWEVEHGCT